MRRLCAITGLVVAALLSLGCATQHPARTLPPHPAPPEIVADRKIPAFKVGGSWRFRLGEIDRWIEEQTHTVQPEKKSSDREGE